MRKHFFEIIVLISIVFASSCKKDFNKTPTVISTSTPGVTPVTYSLVWSDEFDGNTLDTTKWVVENKNDGVNSELEYYLPPNVSVSNGNLVLTARKQLFAGQPYSSGKITTFGKFSSQYGRIEASIKMPLGAGMWPAFWMLGTNINVVNWPTCGEIDIMEHINADNVIYGTMHWNVNGHVSYGGTTTTTPDNYHLYAVEWDANSIRWYVDNNLYLTGNIAANVNGTDAFHLPFFIILNLAVGGSFPNTTVDESILPASMYVDYVRVYKAN
ncbi:MAG TPA: glycoside hydrolase family 16 protein [Mucilaginibacter sp.]|jgi:beta-glucanase (GH16 family)